MTILAVETQEEGEELRGKQGKDLEKKNKKDNQLDRDGKQTRSSI